MLLENADGDTIAISLHEPLILYEDENRILSTKKEYKEFLKKRKEKAQYVTFNSYLNKMTNYADKKRRVFFA